jgi:DNA-binding transcriptional regulator YdaS (Cro superfamily)
MALTPRLNGMIPSVRRLASKGWTADAIARAQHITRAEVRSILAIPVRPPRLRRIWGRMGTTVRRLHFDEGKGAAEIAAALVLDPVKVADFLDRLTPRQHHHRRQGVTVNRPRSAREQAALREWSPNRIADDDGPMLETAAAPELLPVEPSPPAVEPTVWTEGPISPKIGKVDGTPVRRGPARRKPRPSHGKFTPELRAEIRRLAKEGWSRERLAKHFKVKVETIQRLLDGISYACDGAKPVPAPPPAPTIGARIPESPSIPATPYRRTKAASNAKLTLEQRDEIRQLSREGWGTKRLAKRFGVDKKAIHNLLIGSTYSDDPGAPPRPPRPATWREPKGVDLRRRDDGHDDDDLVVLPTPPIAAPPPAVEYPAVIYDDWEPDAGPDD